MISSVSMLKLFWHSEMSGLTLSSLMIDFFISNTTSLARYFLLTIAALSALNFTMLTYYLRRRLSMQKSLGTGFLGMLAGLIGIGCASCGSIILSSVLGLGIAANFLRALPLNGLEFGLLGVFLLILSIYLVAIKIQDPLTCKLKLREK